MRHAAEKATVEKCIRKCQKILKVVVIVGWTVKVLVIDKYDAKYEK